MTHGATEASSRAGHDVHQRAAWTKVSSPSPWRHALHCDVRTLLTLWLLGAWVLLLARGPADPDLWGHVRFGQDMLAGGSIAAADPYSFTADRAWINHEWLSEIAMAAAFDVFGAPGLHLLRFVLIGIVLALVWRGAVGRESGCRLLLVTVAALAITFRVLPVRPQIFSLVGFTAMLTIVIRAEARRRDRLLWLVPPIFAVWVNAHGGWIVGLGALTLWSAVALVERPRRRWWPLPATVAASALATLVNPYGVGMWTFLAGTVGLSRPLIGDWLPLFSLPPSLWFGWLAGAGAWAYAAASGRVPRGRLLATALLGLAALRVSRLDAFFGLFTVFLLQDAWQRRQTARPSARPLVTAVAVVSVAGVAGLALFQARHVRVQDTLVPEREALEYVAAHGLRGRFLTWFDWGQYLIWHLHDRAVLVSMDGRRETVYTQPLIDAHLRFYFDNRPDVAYPDRLAADYVWLPPRLAAVDALRARGWRVAFEGPVSVILQAPGRDLPPRLVQAMTTGRVFPGP